MRVLAACLAVATLCLSASARADTRGIQLPRQLVPNRLRQIDLAVIRHLQQVEQHVRDLLADALIGCGILERKPRLLRRLPLEDLRQLGLSLLWAHVATRGGGPVAAE